MSKVEGSCLCGAIKYASEDEPLYTVICNCKNCQQQSGSAFSLNVIVPSASLKIIGGKPSVYMDSSDSGQPVERQFCSKCGANLFAQSTAHSDKIVIKAGTLNDTSWLQPQVSIWCDSAQSWWSKIETSTMHFAKNPR
jgi:hypothetical protein